MLYIGFEVIHKSGGERQALILIVDLGNYVFTPLHSIPIIQHLCCEWESVRRWRDQERSVEYNFIRFLVLFNFRF